MAGQGKGLTAILICPDQQLAAAFLQTVEPLAEISVVGGSLIIPPARFSKSG